MTKNFRFLTLIIFFVFAVASGAKSQASHESAHAQARKFPLSSFDRTDCRLKARYQECPSKVMTGILGQGKGAVPVLISQLNDSGRTKEPIEPDWSYTDSGDVAYFILISLFTNGDGTFNLPDVPTWQTVMNGCTTGVEGCWREYVRKNGRQSVQQAWMKAWDLNKDKISWDAKEKCFRVAGVITGRGKAGKK
jgi:hypothetical protein